jgi:hypothetical protein
MAMTSPPTASGAAPSIDPAEICTLPPRDLQQRLAWIRREILPHTISSDRIESGRAIELADAEGLRWKLARLIEAEAECCSGIVFEPMPSQAPDRVRLEIRGVDPDASIFDALAENGSAAAISRGPRLVKATGIGVLGSVFVCCVLPIGVGAALGSGAAAFSFLDAPLPIALGALLGGGAAWWWLGRKNPLREAAAGDCGSGC